MGPTASGKSALAESIAEHYSAQLVNADAFMVYRGLDIGTAKPLEKDRYALVDLLEPGDSSGLGAWLSRVRGVLTGLWSDRRSGVIVGGTGLHIRALFEGYSDVHPQPDPKLRCSLVQRESSEGPESLVSELRAKAPEIASKTDLANPVRVRRALEKLSSSRQEAPPSLPPFRMLKFGLQPPLEALEARIRARVTEMFRAGWPEEVALLLRRGVSLGAPGMRAIGYRTVARMLKGELSLNEAIDRVAIETRQYAKRQRTWLRSEPRLHLFQGFGDSNAALRACIELIDSDV